MRKIGREKGVKIGLHHVAMDNAGIFIMLQRNMKNREKRLIDLKGDNLLCTPCQRLGERTKARSNFKHAVFFRDQRIFCELLKQRFILNEVLTKAMLMTEFAAALFSMFQVNSSKNSH